MELTPVQVWNNCLDFIKDNIDEQNYKTWFTPIRPIKLKQSILTVEVPSKFFYEWLEENYISLIKTAIKKELGNNGKLLYNIIVKNNEKNPYSIAIKSINKKISNNPSHNIPVGALDKKFKNPFIIPGLKKVQINSQLNINYSFDNFIEGSSID